MVLMYGEKTAKVRLTFEYNLCVFNHYSNVVYFVLYWFDEDPKELEP